MRCFGGGEYLLAPFFFGDRALDGGRGTAGISYFLHDLFGIASVGVVVYGDSVS